MNTGFVYLFLICVYEINMNQTVICISQWTYDLNRRDSKMWASLSEVSKVHLLKSIIIVTEWISDHNDTNKRNNCLNLICALNVYLNDEYERHFINKMI